MRTLGDSAPMPYGWVSESALEHLAPDDPSDGPVSVRAASPELALLGALLAVAIGDVRRGDPDALAWLEGEVVEGPALTLDVVADHLGLAPHELRARVLRAASSGLTTRRHPLGDVRKRRRAAA